MATPVKVPQCYGLLFDQATEDCQCCLLNGDCSKAMLRPKVASGHEVTNGEIPKDKKSLILAVCHKYGIQPKYYSKKEKREYEITEENMGEFYNLDFLLSSKEALEKLLLARQQ